VQFPPKNCTIPIARPEFFQELQKLEKSLPVSEVQISVQSSKIIALGVAQIL